MTAAPRPGRRVPQVGDAVELRSRFEDTWSPGFEIAEVLAGVYRVRRTSDGALLPAMTSHADVRPVPNRSPWRG